MFQPDDSSNVCRSVLARENGCTSWSPRVPPGGTEAGSERSLITSLAAGEILATLPLYLSPLILGALTNRLGFDPERAGLLLAVEVMVLAWVTLFGAAWVPRHRWRQMARWGVWVALLGNFGSLVATDFASLGVLRVMAGAGEGLVYMACTGYLPLARNRERFAVIITFCTVVSGLTGLTLLPAILDSLGHVGIFLPSAVVTLAAWPCIARLPSIPPLRQTVPTTATGEAASSNGRLLLLPLAMFATQLAQGCFWSLLQLAGEKGGLAEPVIDLALSSSTLFLLVGVCAAGLLDTRVGRGVPLIGGILVNAASMTVALSAAAPGIFLGANFVQASTNLFAVIYQVGLAAAADRTGRIVALVSGALLLGNGIGPAVGGAIIGHLGWSALLPSLIALNGVAVLFYASHFGLQRPP